MARAATARKPAARSAPRKASTRSAASGKAGTRSAPAHRKGGARTSAKQRSAARRSTRSAAPRRNGHGPATRRAPRTARSPRVAAGGAAALPLPVRVMRAPVARAIRARGSGVIDALLHGQGWIVLIGVLLAGIVFFNVDLLRMNREITQMADRASQLKRENARYRGDLAQLASSERIQLEAAELGLVLPAPAEVRYLKSNPTVDARNASKRIIAPDPTLAPDPLVDVAETPIAPVTPTTTTTTPTTTTTTPPTTTTAASPTG
jgi:hypothetical protein